jgi:hypothetical protein
MKKGLGKKNRNKYLKNKKEKTHWKPGDSHFWSGLIEVKDRFLDLSSFNLHNGSLLGFVRTSSLETWLSKNNT